MNRKNTLVWLLLIALTAVSFALGEQRTPALAILAVAAVKSLLVARQFMELRKAAAVWTLALSGILGGILLMALILT